MPELVTQMARDAVLELLDTSNLASGEILVVGCSSSEVAGQRIGTSPSMTIADAILSGLYPPLQERGVHLAAQCCEHLNRAVIVELSTATRYGLDPVNVVPQPKAGGSFASAVYAAFKEPVAVEAIRAHAGMDIGSTLIGMHLRPVAVPVRLSVKEIGEARLVCARTRPKYIGGGRARYNGTLG